MKKLSCSLFVSISATLINSSVTFPSSQRRVDAPSEAKAQTGWSERNHDASHLNHEFYLELSTQFDHVVKQVSPALDRVFREWIGRPLDTDLWKDVRLSGFGVEPLNIVPITWDDFTKVLEDDQLWLLVYAARMYSVIPKRAFKSDDEATRFRSLVTERIPGRKGSAA